MIAVQKPPTMFSPPALRPTHSRHPSAPVVVRPSHTPGVLTIAKPAHPSPRLQHAQAQPRQPRASPKAKQQQRSPQPAHTQAAPVEKPKAPTTSPEKAEQPLLAGDKSSRGRKQNKPSKDARRRGTSVSPSDAAARRHAHQPSPPPARIPSPPKASPAPRAEVPRVKPDSTTSLTDPFTDNMDASSQGQKADQSAFAPPKLASQPSGKLARRRQQASAQVLESPTPKLLSRRKEKPVRAPRNGENAVPPQPSFAPSARPPARRASTDMTLSRIDSFPICDDSSEFGDDSDVTPPTTPIREVASVPAKQGRGTWQQEAFLFEDAPRTAPISSTSGFPFVGHSPCSTPTPAQRRRNHRRVPSEGVFAMSTDEESPASSTSDLFDTVRRRTPVAIPRQRCPTDPYGGSSPSSLGVGAGAPQTSSSAPASGYFAGSVFQNSPSPDDLPAPSFAL